MKNYYFFLRNQVENLGDWVLNNNLISLFDKRTKLTVNDDLLTDDYRVYLKESNTIEYSSANGFGDIFSLDFIKQIRSNKLKVGAILLSPGHPSFKSSIKNNLVTFIKILILRFYKRKGIKVAFLGAYINNDEIKGLQKTLFKHYCNQFFVFALRDLNLVKQLNNKGINKITYCPDLFLLTHDPNKYVRNTNLNVNTAKRILLSFRTEGPEIKDYNDYENKLNATIDDIVKTFPDNVEINVSYQVQRDFEPSEKLANKLKKEGKNVVFHPTMLTVSQATNLYKDMDYIFSNRLHCLLFGLVTGAHSVAVSDFKQHLKIAGAFKDLGFEHLLLDIETDKTFSNNLDRLLQNDSIDQVLIQKKSQILEFAKQI